MKQLPFPIARRFSPAEVEAITSVPIATLRDWKRRDLVHPDAVRGWQKFSLGTLSLIAVLKAASDAGLEIKSMMAWAPAWASAVASHILDNPAAWEDPADVAELRTFERLSGGRVEPARLGVAIANGPYVLADNAQSVAAQHGALSYVVLDLQRIADRIVEQAACPISKLGRDVAEHSADGSVIIHLGERPGGDE